MTQPQPTTEPQNGQVQIDLDRIHAQYGRIQADLILRLSVAEQERDDARRDAGMLAGTLTTAQARIAELEGTENPDVTPREPAGKGKAPRGGGQRGGGHGS